MDYLNAAVTGLDARHHVRERGVIRGDLTPECEAAVRAVLEALGKKAGPEDDRTEGQRFHDALQLACASQPRVCGSWTGQRRHPASVSRATWTSTVWCVYHGGIKMEFEFDPLKSESNREKHGVDFVQAQEIWQDAMRVEVPARTTGEPRWLVVGRMGGRHWSAVVTYREDRIRIISVRRARDEEIEIYEV
jgi:hypothetical protein